MTPIGARSGRPNGNKNTELLHINRHGDITVNALGESGKMLSNSLNKSTNSTMLSSHVRDARLVQLIGSAQKKAERLMMMIRNQI